MGIIAKKGRSKVIIDTWRVNLSIFNGVVVYKLPNKIDFRIASFLIYLLIYLGRVYCLLVFDRVNFNVIGVIYSLHIKVQAD